MPLLTVKFTTKELDLLTVLASDQLFRREFIDSRIPGNPLDPVELTLGKHLLERLRSIAHSSQTTRVPIARRN